MVCLHDSALLEARFLPGTASWISETQYAADWLLLLSWVRDFDVSPTKEYSRLESARRRNIFEYSKTALQFGELANYLQAASTTVGVPSCWIDHALAKEEFCDTIAAALRSIS